MLYFLSDTYRYKYKWLLQPSKRLSLITPAGKFDEKQSLDSIVNDAQIQPKNTPTNQSIFTLSHLYIIRTPDEHEDDVSHLPPPWGTAKCLP